MKRLPTLQLSATDMHPLRQEIWGKPYLHPDDLQHVSVTDLVSFIRKSYRFT